MEYLMHERDRERVQTLNWKGDLKTENPVLSINSAQTTFTSTDPNHFNFDHVICDRGYYDKDEIIQNQPVDETSKMRTLINTQSLKAANSTSQITMDISSHYHLTQFNAAQKRLKNSKFAHVSQPNHIQ